MPRAAILAARQAAPQVARAWRESEGWRATAAAFAACPPDDPDPVAQAAERLLGDPGWAAALLTPLVEALAADPLCEPPLKVSRDALRIGAILFDSPAVSIAASVTDAAALRRIGLPDTIVFSGRRSVTRVVRAGGARQLRWHGAAVSPDAPVPACAPLPDRMLADGDIHRFDGRNESQLLADATGDVVTIVATIKPGAAPLVREHDRASGAFRRYADADDRPSRADMLLAFLRTAGRSDAGPCFDGASRDVAFHLRWSGMRQWLALDAEAALPRLAEMARSDPHAEIRTLAARTLMQVAPQLERARCRA